MAKDETGDVALLSIHPKYAEAILEGRKKVEFRKINFTKEIKEIFIYATSPIQKVIGTFSVKELDSDSPKSLWKKYGSVGEISHRDYKDYYKNHDVGMAIVIDSASSFESPMSLSDFGINVAPQSFVYL